VDLNKLDITSQEQTVNNLPNRLIVLCRYNQARSIIASSVLATLFPLVHFSSAGINAVDGNHIPDSVRLIAKEWNIQLRSDRSRSLLAVQSELLAVDLIIIAETGFLSEIPSEYLEGKQVLSMQDSRFSPQFVPIDPINASPFELKMELAKTIMTTVQLVAQTGLRRYENEVEVYIPESDQSFTMDSIHVWNYAKERGANLLFADFRAPNFEIAKSLGVEVRALVKPNNLSSADLTLSTLTSNTPYVVATEYEVNDVEKFALSQNLRNVIWELSRERELVILTGPMSAGSLSFVDPFLIASQATRLISLVPRELDT
jgi:protein-tyrosine-phosphatase